MTWRIKDSLPQRRAVYYGKVIARRPSFIAREMLGAFLRLRIEPGGYRKLYLRGGLSHCGKLVMDALSKRGAAETRVLKLSSGYAQASRRAVFDRAMAELQEKFLALKVDERSDPFSYVWDTMAHRWPDAIAEARRLTRKEAAYAIVAKYFETAAFGNERTIARLLGIDTALVETAARKLEREGKVARGVRIDGHPGRNQSAVRVRAVARRTCRRRPFRSKNRTALARILAKNLIRRKHHAARPASKSVDGSTRRSERTQAEFA